jgi:hypothetical protein
MEEALRSTPGTMPLYTDSYHQNLDSVLESRL